MKIEVTATMGDSNHVILVFIKAKERDSEKPNTILLLKNISRVLRQFVHLVRKKSEVLRYYELNVSPDQMY